jgi:hypothetical protein
MTLQTKVERLGKRAAKSEKEYPTKRPYPLFARTAAKPKQLIEAISNQVENFVSVLKTALINGIVEKITASGAEAMRHIMVPHGNDNVGLPAKETITLAKIVESQNKKKANNMTFTISNDLPTSPTPTKLIN